ncbi:MAG: hypothetical protein ACFFA0_15520 [Promethearchaeota archaeon]
MTEEDLVITSKNRNDSNKRSNLEYVDLAMAIFNSVTIILIFPILEIKSLISILLGFSFVGILLMGTIIMFFKRNPFYIDFCYGLTLCGFLADIDLSMGNPFFAILFAPQALYIYSLIAKVFIGTNTYLLGRPDYIYPKKTQKQISEENRRRAIHEIKNREIENKFKFNEIILIALCCSIGLFITLIISI